MKVNIKKINSNAITPTYGSTEAAGLDLYALIDTETNSLFIPSYATVKINTGIAMEIPKGYFGAVYARSGLSIKNGLRPANCVGVIDSDYRGEVIVLMHNSATLENHVYPQFILTDGTTQDSYEYGYLPVGTVVIRAGDRIAQGVLTQVPKAKFIKARQVSKTERGEGGLGSTGK